MGMRPDLSGPCVWRNWKRESTLKQPGVVEHSRDTFKTMFLRYSKLETPCSRSWFLSSLEKENYFEIISLSLTWSLERQTVIVHYLLISSLSNLAWSPSRTELASLSLNSSVRCSIFFTPAFSCLYSFISFADSCFSLDDSDSTVLSKRSKLTLESSRDSCACHTSYVISKNWSHDAYNAGINLLVSEES